MFYKGGAYLNYTNINEHSWDKWASEKCVWTLPITHQEFLNAQNGKMSLYLTPLKPVPRDWYLPLKNKRILGLASGGGQQCPLFVAGGATVTVFDISSKQLKSDKLVAEREGYDISLIKGDMSQKFPFEDESFDIVFNPVSNSYIKDIFHVWNECYRVLKHGGQLLSGFANPTIYLYEKDKNEYRLSYAMPFNPLIDLSDRELERLSYTDGIQFGHSFSEQITGQIDAGFVLTGFYEDYHPTDNAITSYNTYIGETASYLTKYMPIYFATKSIKI